MIWIDTYDSSRVSNYLQTPLIMVANGLFGVGDSVSGLHRMAFRAYLQSDYSGSAGFTQLITGSMANNFDISIEGDQLDNQQWYNGLVDIGAGLVTANVIPLQDGPVTGLPTIPIRGTVGIDLSFKVYLRFRPNAGDPNENIFVTVGFVDWRALGSGTKTGDTWAVDPGASVDGPMPSDKEDFPVWTDTFRNLVL